MLSDQEHIWIKASKQGDIKAFEKLAKSYQDMIYTLCYRILKNKDDANDLCQDVLIKMFRNIHQYEVQSPFGAWVYRICYNESINKIRKLKKAKENQDHYENQRENWLDTSNALNEMQKTEKKEILINAINQLPEPDSFVLLAYYFDELSVKEISEITDLSIGNIKVKLHRCRKLLYNYLSQPAIKEQLL